MLLLSATHVVADRIVTDIDTINNVYNQQIDINSLYWQGSDKNSPDNSQLKNTNQVTEEVWLEALLGQVYNDPKVTYIDRFEEGYGGLGYNLKQLTDFDPGFKWDYAVVKYSYYWIAYEDTDKNDKLTTDLLSHGISHVTFFDPPTTVPEPMTILLYGLGFAGAGLYRRIRRSK